MRAPSGRAHLDHPMAVAGCLGGQPMDEALLRDAAERALRYLRELDARGVAPDPAAVERLRELDAPLQEGPVDPAEVLAQLDAHAGATMAMNGPRFFGFV